MTNYFSSDSTLDLEPHSLCDPSLSEICLLLSLPVPSNRNIGLFVYLKFSTIGTTRSETVVIPPVPSEKDCLSYGS